MNTQQEISSNIATMAGTLGITLISMGEDINVGLALVTLAVVASLVRMWLTQGKLKGPFEE